MFLHTPHSILMKKGRKGHVHRVNLHRLHWRTQLFTEQLGQCYYCGVACNDDNKQLPTSFTLDHIVPLSRGGTDNSWNYVGACYKCNREKGDKNVSHMVPAIDKWNRGVPTDNNIDKKRLRAKRLPKVYWRRGKKFIRKSRYD